jgi:hypothetical protein
MTQILMIEADDETIAKLRVKIDGVGTMRVVGLFQLMRTRCKCPDDMTGRHRGKLSSKGQRFKWWIHRGCGKPTPGSHPWIGNMLDQSEIKPRKTDDEPRIVVDSISIHDFGFHNGER